MAKDTEKLIRQLSLISYLMAERRPVTALEIRRDVEGYSGMNEDAFARRFYADRAELESLGIQLTVDKPIDGVAEQENYSLRPENFHLPAIAFTDEELASLQFALNAARRRVRLRRAAAPGAPADLLGAARRRSARPTRGRRRSASPAAPAATTSPSAWRRSRRRSSARRRSPSTTTRWSATTSARARSIPYHLLFRGGQFYLLGPLPRARRAARLPPVADPRQGRLRDEGRARLQAAHGLRPARVRQPRRRGSTATPIGTAEVWVSERIAWQVERHYGRFGEVAPGEDGGRSSPPPTPTRASSPRWVLSLGEHARVDGPAELVDEVGRARRAAGRAPRASCRSREPVAPARGRRRTTSRSSRPTAGARRRSALSASRAWSRWPRSSSRRGGRASVCASPDVCERLQITERRAARGRQRPQRRQLRRRVLRPVRRGQRRRLRSRSTPSPTPTTSRARRGCCRSRPRRSSPRSTSSASTCPRAR